MRVGFIGLGRMGLPMARHLVEAGHDVTVHNRTRSKEEALTAVGAAAAGSPREVTERSDLVLACLPTLEASEAVFLSENGVVPHARAGMILIDHSTIGPGLARRIADAAGDRGAEFLDAPISGGPAGAENASLTIMAGGTAEAFESAFPLLDAMGENVRHMGPVGAGCVTKLINQLLTFVHATAAAEAMALACTAGARPEQLLPVLRTAWGQSTMLERGIGKYSVRDFEAGAPLRLFRKDMGLVTEMAAEGGISLPLATAAARRMEEALGMGLEDEDLVAVIRPYERDTGIEVGGG